MRWLSRSAVGVVGLLAVLLAAAWVLPAFWDWSRQRATMEALAGLALGRTVHIEGAIALTLLPEPMLTASGVRVLNGAEAGELHVQSLRLGVAMWPLLRGQVVARELVLSGAELRLPWPPISAASAPAMAIPAWYGGFGGRVENGRIAIGALRLQDIQLSVSSSDAGILTLSGRLGMPGGAGQSWDIAVRLGQPEADGTAALDATLNGRKRLAGVSLAFAGRLGGSAGLVGRLRAQGPDLSQLMIAPALAFQADGPLRAWATEWTWDKVALDLGGSAGEAAFRLPLDARPVLRAAVRMARMDLDAWAAVLERGVTALRGATSAWAMELDIQAQLATLAGGTLRDLRLALVADAGVLRVREAAFTAPGGAGLRLSGVIGGADGLELTGRIDLLAAENAPGAGPPKIDLRAGLRWLAAAWGGVLPEIPAGVLRRAELGAALAWAPGRLALTGLSGRIDDSQISGDLRWQGGPAPNLRVALAVDRLVLDGWVPAGWPIGWPNGALAGLVASGGGVADVQLRVGTLALRELVMETLALEARLEPDRLVLRRLEGRAYPQQAGGVRIVASAAMGPGGRIADGRLEMSAESAAPLAAWVPEDWRGTPDLWSGALALRGTFAGPPDALVLQISAELGDARLEAEPVWHGAWGRFGLRLSLRHPGAGRFLAALGLVEHATPTNLGWPGEGSFALQAQLAVRDEGTLAESFDLIAGALRASGRGRLGWRDGVMTVNGQINAETLPLPWPRQGVDNTLARNTLFWHGLRRWQGHVQLRAAQLLHDDAPVAQDAVCDVAVAAQILRLSGCTARWAGGGVAITAALDGAAQPPSLRLDGAVAEARMAGLLAGGPLGDPAEIGPAAIDLGAERVDATFALSGAGADLAAMAASLAGPIAARGTAVTWHGFDLAAAYDLLAQAALRAAPDTELALRQSLTSGQTLFTQLDMTAALRDGVVLLQHLQGQGPSGTIDAEGEIRIWDRDLNLRLRLYPEAVPTDWPPLGQVLSGPAVAARRISDVAAAMRWLVAPRR